MKYVANPVVVDAFQILEVGTSGSDGIRLAIGDGESENSWVTATPGMTSRMTPAVGDYWVIQSDGYIYLNPREVFERKYTPASLLKASA